MLRPTFLKLSDTDLKITKRIFYMKKTDKLSKHRELMRRLASHKHTAASMPNGTESTGPAKNAL